MWSFSLPFPFFLPPRSATPLPLFPSSPLSKRRCLSVVGMLGKEEGRTPRAILPSPLPTWLVVGTTVHAALTTTHPWYRIERRRQPATLNISEEYLFYDYNFIIVAPQKSKVIKEYNNVKNSFNNPVLFLRNILFLINAYKIGRFATSTTLVESLHYAPGAPPPPSFTCVCVCPPLPSSPAEREARKEWSALFLDPPPSAFAYIRKGKRQEWEKYPSHGGGEEREGKEKNRPRLRRSYGEVRTGKRKAFFSF